MSSGFGFDDIESPVAASTSASIELLSRLKARRKTVSGAAAFKLEHTIAALERRLAKTRQRTAARQQQQIDRAKQRPG
jgi:hypothetical protein